MLEISAIPAFTDNYIWLIKRPNTKACLVVDPGEAAPVLALLEKDDLALAGILITHHHTDHIGGVAEITAAFPVPIYGNAHDAKVPATHAIEPGEDISISALDLSLHTLAIPGHTLGHIAYYTPGHLFCGDTLFAAGCGRLFEGTPDMMCDSLAKITDLPDDTLIYCAHEYTEANLRFALTVEPSNAALQQRYKDVCSLRNASPAKITLPTRLDREKSTNPFLRCDQTEIIQSAQKHTKTESTDYHHVFSIIRQLKDYF